MPTNGQASPNWPFALDGHNQPLTDEGRSWIVVNEINRFIWPGVDLLPVPGKGDYDYGVLPPGLFRQVRAGIASWVRSRKLRTTPRSG